MGMAANDIRTSEADSVASTATARVVEIDGGDPRHHRKLYRSETRLGTDEVAGESFQVNQTCTGFAFRFEHRKWNRGRNGLHQLGQPVAPSILLPVFKSEGEPGTYRVVQLNLNFTP